MLSHDKKHYHLKLTDHLSRNLVQDEGSIVSSINSVYRDMLILGNMHKNKIKT